MPSSPNPEFPTFRRITAYILILVALGCPYIYFTSASDEDPNEITIETPSPALGKAVATAVHQAVTDPYFAPLEKLADYLSEDPERDMITIDQLTKWATDDEMPTCFVWDADGSNFKMDHGASPWVIEEVVDRLRNSIYRDNPRGLLFINMLRIEGERYWLGFMKVPRISDEPTQMAGVFFSLDRYLSVHVPRLIDNLVSRRRFPLVPFQLDAKPIHNEPDGDISIRILDATGGIYLQRGRTFDSDKMIYSESKWYPKPIVCLQEGWDLQVFSANVVSRKEKSRDSKRELGLFIAMVVLVSILYWWGGGVKRMKDEG